MKGIYRLARIAAPPSRPRTAAVGMAPAPAAPDAPAGMSVVVGVIPDVKGTVLSDLAPEKAGDCVGFDGSGVRVVAAGLRTLPVMLVNDCSR